MQKSIAYKTLGFYFKAVSRYPWYLFGLLVLPPIGVFLNNYVLPYIIAEVIDVLSTTTIAPGQVWETFGNWIIIFAVSAIVGELIVWRLAVLVLWKLERKVAFDLYMQCFNHLAEQSARFHANRFGGSLVSQTNKFIGSFIRLEDTLMFQLLPLISSLVFTLIILGPRLPLFTALLAVFCATFMAIALLSFKKIRRLSEAEAATNTKLSGLIADMVSNVLAVKSYSNELSEKRRFERANDKAQLASGAVMRSVIKRDVGFGAVLVGISVAAFIVLIGGQAWFDVSLGTLVLAVTYSMQILGRMWDFNSILRNVNRSFGDAHDMTKILLSPIEVKDPAEPLRFVGTKGQIEFKAMSFRHKDDSKADSLFDNFNLSVKPGEKIGLVGRSGSGKTTLTKLLLRFSDLDSGEIAIDGTPINKVLQKDLRSVVAYVPQEPLLFHRSLKENIAYGKPEAGISEIKKAAEKAHAVEFIEKLPKGYLTLVGERGVKLSGGQRQRIAIARAILKDAPILVLDEATSALDSESEKLIQAALWELMEGRTALVIAHRLSTIQKMDRIVVLDEGKIIEQGSHQDLIQRGGVYSELWAHQSGGFIEE